MRPIASTLTETNTMTGEEVKFTISQANSAWVMRSMADLYSNRELACIREYSTNAYDANKEKALRDGHDVEPIHVTLPSAMNPYFVVQDFGVGMSETELREIYTEFGESTKRDSDEFNGMLGFGSKSAIAYTNTFTVTSVKNGIKTVGVITRREDAMGGYLVTMRLVMTNVETADPDGVRIEIPVHNWREFEQKAMDFYRFWLPGRVLVNGKAPQWAVGEKIDDNLYYYPHAGASYVVMGNVPYKIANPDALFPAGMNKISFVAYVPVGAVEFVPAREALKYSEHTKNNLHKIISDFVDKSVDMAKKEIAAATTHADAYKAWSKWRKIIGRNQVDDLTFKGDKLVDNFPIKGQRHDYNSYRYGTWTIDSWAVSDVQNTIFVTNFDINLAAAHKRKVREWLGVKNMSASYAIFTEATKIDSPWVDPARVVTWETVKKEAPKAPSKPRASVAWGRKAGSFDLISQNGRQAEQDVPNTTPLYYVGVKEYNVDKNLDYVLKLFKMDVKVVLVPANRLGKFLRHYPHAKNILSELRGSLELDGNKSLSKEALDFLRMEHGERRRLSKMDFTKVSDPEVQRLINLAKSDETTLLADYNKNRQLAYALGLGAKFKKHDYEHSYNARWQPLQDAYPLTSAFYSSDYDAKNPKNLRINEHVYYYMNAVYAARKAGKNV